MIKKIGSVIFLVFIHHMVWAATPGRFFTISSNGAPVAVNVTLCLNAKGPISCQDYNVPAANLNLLTTVPKNTYPFAGIKINSPYYSIGRGSGCTQLKNGFCMFSVSNTSAAHITIKIPDYIVIGTGTAGAVLANKLSADKQTYVIALQNGPNLDQDPLIYESQNALITVLSGLIGRPLYVLSETTQQMFINNRILNWIYAVALGGASSVNAGAWCRGTNHIYRRWEAIGGADWSVNRILNTYVALENYNGKTTDPSARGYNGPLPIFQPPIPTEVSVKFTNAIINATGVHFVLDYNDPRRPIGASTQMQYTQMGENGALRASSSIVFLNRTVMDKNGNGVNGRQLHVLFNSTADNVIWNGNTAVGITYYQNGVQKRLYATKGIIVSAGIKSSSFLMRSGVGPKQLLQSLNIPVVYDNPHVGRGLADQPHIVLLYTTNPDDTPSSPLLNLTGKIINALADTKLGKELIRTIGTKVNVQNGLFSQIAWLPAPGATGSQRRIRKVRIATINPIPGLTAALVDLADPKSRGWIQIKSKDPFVEPIMNLGEFDNASDYDLYFNTFKTYIPDINSQLQSDSKYQMIFPDPSVLNDDKKLKKFILDEVGTNMHFQSHCRMGDVVDHKGQVIGVNNLYVADDSIVPAPMDGSPMATAYLIAANVANILQGQ